MIVGIDLGTTNSAVAVWRDGAVEMIPNSLGHRLTPSAVSLGDDGEVLVGLAARERQVSHPGQTATAFKRLMGSTRQTVLGDQRFLPEELSSFVLRSLKADAEAYLGVPVEEAVMAAPAYFNDKQRKATVRAGELAGLKVERLVNEPTAAAIAHGIADREREARFLVFDLGGGTFDVSIVEIFEGVLEVRASAGDTRLGGEDFNEILIRSMVAHTPKWKRAIDEEPRLRERLRAAAERTRRALSTQPQSVMSVVWDGRTEEMAVSEATFAVAAEPLLARLRQPVIRALSDGRLRIEEMDEVVLVGGATRMPAVRQAVTRMFSRFPSTSIDPDEAVARGAAIQAGLKARDAALKEVVVTDVCPFTLGVEVAERLPSDEIEDGFFSPIIERNTTIPASRVAVYRTMFDGQSVLDLGVYQGEARRVENNVFLGNLRVPIPAAPAGAIAIECRFSYDINGILEVDAHVPATGERRQLVIADEEVAGREDFAARRAALATLKLHPRDADANRAAIARGERCYEESIGARRARVQDLIQAFEAALLRQDPRAADRARSEFLQALDELEGATVL